MTFIYQDRDLLERLIKIGQLAPYSPAQIQNLALKLIQGLKQNVSVAGQQVLSPDYLENWAAFTGWLEQSQASVDGKRIFYGADEKIPEGDVERVALSTGKVWKEGLDKLLQELQTKAAEAKNTVLSKMINDITNDFHTHGLTSVQPKPEEGVVDQSKTLPTTEKKPEQQTTQPGNATKQRSTIGSDFVPPMNENVFSIRQIRKFIAWIGFHREIMAVVGENLTSLNTLVESVYRSAIYKTAHIDIIGVPFSSSNDPTVSALKSTFNLGSTPDKPVESYNLKELANIAVILSNIAFQVSTILNTLKGDIEVSSSLGENVLDSQINIANHYINVWKGANSQLMMEFRNSQR